MANQLSFSNRGSNSEYQAFYFWRFVQSAGIGCIVALIITLFIRPEAGLFITWRLIIPFAPLLIFVAPGLWRNVCPISALNMLPGWLNVSRSGRVPGWLRDNGYAISLLLFFVIVPLRKVLFNYNGAALAILMVVLSVLAVVMGGLFQRKSGMCNTFCPIMPVEQIYRQTPFFQVKTQSCPTCTGCTRLCFDQKPGGSYLGLLRGRNKRQVLLQQLFVAVLPGFIIAYFFLPDPGADSAEISIFSMYIGLIAACLLSAGLFFLLKKYSRLHFSYLTTLFGGTAFCAYYWFNAVSIGELTGSGAEAITWLIRIITLALVGVWVYRTCLKAGKTFRLSTKMAS